MEEPFGALHVASRPSIYPDKKALPMQTARTKGQYGSRGAPWRTMRCAKAATCSARRRVSCAAAPQGRDHPDIQRTYTHAGGTQPAALPRFLQALTDLRDRLIQFAASAPSAEAIESTPSAAVASAAGLGLASSSPDPHTAPRMLPLPSFPPSLSPRSSGYAPSCHSSHSLPQPLFTLPWTHNPSPQPQPLSHAPSSHASSHSTPPSTTHMAGALLLWHTAVSLHQRAWTSVLWHVGCAASAAERTRRSMPPPHQVPSLMHWTATNAAVHAEESLALALAHTSAAASAVSRTASEPPHLPLLRHQRRRLLATALPLLEQLHYLQQGCTTHVLLRFVLYSALQPALRRELLLQLDVMGRRAAQLAVLQAQHEAWLSAQHHQGSGASTRTSTRKATKATGDKGDGGKGQQQQQQLLASRWYGSVLAPELAACAKQLQLLQPPTADTAAPAAGTPAAPSAGPVAATSSFPHAKPNRKAPRQQRQAHQGRDPQREQREREQHAAEYAQLQRAAAAPSDPPGRFDLRDLYRLVRVVEVAVEDLQREV